MNANDIHLAVFLHPAPLHTTPRYNSATNSRYQLCADCTIPVALEPTSFGVLEPIDGDGVRDGNEVAHSDCYAQRCPDCGAAWKSSCAHRFFKNGYPQ